MGSYLIVDGDPVRPGDTSVDKRGLIGSVQASPGDARGLAPFGPEHEPAPEARGETKGKGGDQG